MSQEPAGRTWVRSLGGALAAWVMAGCSGGSPYLDPKGTGAEGQDLATQLTGEADALMHLLGFGQILVAAFLLFLGWALTRVIHGAAILAWRMGLDAGKRLAPVRSAANALVAGAVGYLLLRRFLVAAPVITLITLALAASVILLVLAKPLQNIWAGLLLSFRRRIREGDRLTVGNHVGTVRDVGLTRLLLRCADGASVLVPNHVVLSETIRVEQAKNTVPVSVRVPGQREDPGPDLLRAARRSALLSPFRAPGTPVEVSVAADGDIEVMIQVWSERAVREARVHLSARLRAALAPAAPAPKDPGPPPSQPVSRA